MRQFAGKIAVITGGGTGMGRELVRQLVAEGCHVAMCDILPANMAETKRICEADGVPQGTRITTHVADVSSEADILRFRDEVAERMETDKIHLLFNNAGIAGGGSLFTDSRASWERTFNICWYGVYYSVRAFLPMLQRAEEAHVVNTSSINGFWATLGPTTPHTSYSAAKFAVKGFTEALITDLAVNAPHIKCSVVMPGHVGTAIVSNSRKIMEGVTTDALTPAELVRLRERFIALGKDASALTDEVLQTMSDDAARLVVETAPTSAAEGAKIMLDGVRNERWRILLGPDAELVDEHVRATPEAAYTDTFFRHYGPAYARQGHHEKAF